MLIVFIEYKNQLENHILICFETDFKYCYFDFKLILHINSASI